MNDTINPHLQLYLEKEIIPQYASFDKGHNIDHVEKVIHDSLQIAKDYAVNNNMVYTIAAYHDIGIMQGRENHHITSGIILQNDKQLCQWFDKEELKVMQEAVEDHRASNKHEPRSIYGKIVAEADRDISVEKIIYRSIAFGIGNYPQESYEQQYDRVYSHLKTKYGENGYLKLWLETDKNKKGLSEVHKVIGDQQKLKEMFNSLYGRLSSESKNNSK